LATVAVLPAAVANPWQNVAARRARAVQRVKLRSDTVTGPTDAKVEAMTAGATLRRFGSIGADRAPLTGHFRCNINA
jgi:hypothetical protein